MTLSRLPLFRTLPPSAELWARYVVGGEPEQYSVEGFVLHLLHGGVGGGLFGLGFSLVDGRTERRRRFSVVALGVVYSLTLSVFGSRVVFRRLLGTELAADERLVFHVGHVIYGLTLGAWMSARE